MHIAVISIDALINSDLEYLRSLPTMGRLLHNAAIIPEMMSIYPTYTYPCHVTAISGCYPDRTGVVHNLVPSSGEWNWYRKSNKQKIVTDYLKPMKSAAVMWPVLGAADIDILVPEIWAERPEDNPDEVFRSASSEKGYQYYLRHKDKLEWMRTPGMDNFAAAVYSDIIREERPDISFFHLSYLDHQRHNKGYESWRVEYAMDFIDEKLSEVIKAFDDAGIYEDTLFIIMGDHGHRNFQKTFYLQEAINRKGFGRRIISHNTTLSSEIYINGISEKDAYSVLEEIKSEYPDMIEDVLCRDELESRYHLKGDFALMVEACDGVSLSDKSAEVICEELPALLSAHGFKPEKGPFSPLVFSGLEAKTAEKRCSLVDIAPTILKLLGREGDMDGRALAISIR